MDNDLRYKTTPREKHCYKLELDKCIADKEAAKRGKSSMDTVGASWAYQPRFVLQFSILIAEQRTMG